MTTLHKEALDRLRGEQDWPRVRPAFTCDLWCSHTQREYLTITAHWIDETFRSMPPTSSSGPGATSCSAPLVRPCQWILRRRVVATQQIDGDDEDKVSAISK